MISVSIKKRPNGTYRARWRPADGRERSRAFKHKRDAEAFKTKLQADSLRGIYVSPDAGRIPLVEAIEQHIARQTKRYNTERNAAYAVRQVRGHFGDKTSLAQVNTSDLQTFVTALGKRLAPRTVGRIFGFVQQTCREAHLDGVIGLDPSARVRLPRHAGGEIVVPTDEDVLALYRAAPDGFAVAIVLGAGLGLRPSEATGLTADRIDFLRREVTVDRQWHGRLDCFEPVKYAASNRRVPAAAEVLDELARHIDEHGCGEYGVLLHANGRPLNSNRLAWRWERTAKGARSAHTMHALRHHYASSLLSAGCSIVAAQRALGHARPSITLDAYGHLMPSDWDRIRGASGRVWTANADSARTGAP
jgi:integrase